MNIPTPYGGRSGASSGPRWAKRLIKSLMDRRGSRGSPLGLLPPLGERGGHAHNYLRGHEPHINQGFHQDQNMNHVKISDRSNPSSITIGADLPHPTHQ